MEVILRIYTHDTLTALQNKPQAAIRPSASFAMENQLYNHPAFTTRAEFLSVDERVALAYQRAKAVLRAWGTHLSLDPVPKSADHIALATVRYCRP